MNKKGSYKEVVNLMLSLSSLKRINEIIHLKLKYNSETNLVAASVTQLYIVLIYLIQIKMIAIIIMIIMINY